MLVTISPCFVMNPLAPQLTLLRGVGVISSSCRSWMNELGFWANLQNGASSSCMGRKLNVFKDDQDQQRLESKMEMMTIGVHW